MRCSTLISIWGDGFIQAKLEGPYRNRSLFEDIAKQMDETERRGTWLQCQCKAKSLNELSSAGSHDIDCETVGELTSCR